MGDPLLFLLGFAFAQPSLRPSLASQVSLVGCVESVVVRTPAGVSTMMPEKRLKSSALKVKSWVIP